MIHTSRHNISRLSVIYLRTLDLVNMLQKVLRPWYNRAFKAKLHPSNVQGVVLAILHDNVQDLVLVAYGFLVFADVAAAEGSHGDVDFVDIGD